MVTYLEYHNDAENSHKFWTAHIIDGLGSSYESGVRATYGRIGGNHQAVYTKYFDSEGGATTYLAKMISQKIQKGYKETC